MGNWVTLKADDGHQLDAYVATPAEEAVGAVVVVLLRIDARREQVSGEIAMAH